MGVYDQAEFETRFEWGLPGLQTLAPISDCAVIVDVLSFTTCVSIAVDQGAVVFPFQSKDESAAEFARTLDAHLAVERGRTKGGSDPPYSLSPKSMLGLTEGTRIVLPSPNGSTLSFAARDMTAVVLAGCLRNAHAVAEAARSAGRTVAVIAAGERWAGRDELRPAVEDLLGAGAILRSMPGTKSPEAQNAITAFEGVSERLSEFMAQAISAKELRALGYEEDVTLSSELDVSSSVPLLRDRAFVRMKDSVPPDTNTMTFLAPARRASIERLEGSIVQREVLTRQRTRSCTK